MKIVYTKHARAKLGALRRLGWKITKSKIQSTIKIPKWSGVSTHGQKTAMSLLDRTHIIRIVFRREDDIITVITFHIARRGRYESTLR